MRAISFFAVLMFWAQGIVAEAAEIRIVASPGISAAFAELGPRFERATGHKLAIQYGLIPAQKQQIESGAFDLAIVPSAVLEEAIKKSKIAADTRTSLVRVSLGVGVRTGSAKPDLTSTDAFKRALLNAASVTYVTDEPTGQRITKDFERLGIADAMKTKTKPQATTTAVWKAVASGEAELGFGFASNAVGVSGVELAGLFPDELQFSTVLTAGLGVTAQQADPAKALVKYLLSPEAADVLKAKGLTPIAP